MSKIEYPTLVPELRFPEFVEQDGWKPKILEEVCDLQAGKFVKAANIKSEKDDSLYPCYGGNGLRGFTESFTHNGNYSLIGRQGALCGNINFVSGKFHATEHAVVVEPKEGVDNSWLYYELCRLNLNRFATGQAQPGLSVDNLYRVDTHVPLVEKEQQKIADCLVSIDGLITTNTKKSDSLKLHKKGLIQKLFPEEGKRVPELRFSDFEGDWKPASIAKMGMVVTGSTPSTSHREYYGGEHLFVSPADISENRFIETTKSTLTTEGIRKSRVVQSGSVLFVCIGSTIGKTAQVKYDCATNQQINAITAFPGYDDDFLYYLLSFHSLTISELAGKQAVPIINKATFSKVVLMVPEEKEQKRIADILSSIDELISALNKKIEALKAHKKGLVQRIFPYLERVSE
ncbi:MULTISPECIES: restriction endonuclease subunit S [Gammaproteobacteria]|uniref:restriction endonuclease subunit S n=1 Tax=Gammaproteobacteria TaxID=1236 RepID=UPI0027E51AC7|nr:restriction endonuclease subunit S [Pseudoalteromonas xiamenensis]WMN58940.1 restriction endonuclease subunit S [Pseudoalteromonas xiamenensis]